MDSLDVSLANTTNEFQGNMYDSDPNDISLSIKVKSQAPPVPLQEVPYKMP